MSDEETTSKSISERYRNRGASTVFDVFIAIECVAFAGGRMRQKTNFKAFKEAENVRKFLEAQLQIGVARPIDVFSFLGEQELKHSGLIDNSEDVGTVYEKPFEHTIGATAPAKGFLFEFSWSIEFHFDNQTLVKIDVYLTGFAL
jgi:hypothetical protein